MTRYIQRHSRMKRIVHNTHLTVCLLLILTGLFIFIKPLGAAVGPDVSQVMRIIHRAGGVIFIVIPTIAAFIAPKGLSHMMRNLFEKWDADDKKFVKLFLPYLFAAKKVHMPPQRELKSGQRLADGILLLSAVVIAISGVMLWIGAGVFGYTAMNVALFLHDLAFLGIAVFGFAHAYLGSGTFQPYRGMHRVMLGDGKISESDALYHWGHWAEDELQSGKNVVEE